LEEAIEDFYDYDGLMEHLYEEDDDDDIED
jgi:hypothetical protein